MAVWNLPQRIIELSNAETWAEAAREWVPDGVEILEGETSQCLCGHNPIVELCHIRNTENGNTAIVGNHCIQKFQADDPGHAVFGNVPKIIAAAKKVMGDISASANPELIRMAQRRGVLNDAGVTFYNDIWRKRNLSERQLAYKINLNQQILYQMLLTPRQAFARLSSNPLQGTAGPKLVEYAFGQGVLTQANRNFYLQVWHKAHSALSQAQAKYRSDLNQKMIRLLRFA